MATHPTEYPVPGGVFHHREGVEFPDDTSIVPTHGDGCYLWSESGDRFLDYMMGSGPVILGHAHPDVVAAIKEQAEAGTSFYKTERIGLEFADRIVEAVPCADALKFTSSGGEATYFALRLARAYSGRSGVLKFQGAYHGFHDAVMCSSDKRDSMEVHRAGYPDGTVDTAGALSCVTDRTVVAPFNDLEATAEILAAHADELAAVIVEPLQRSLAPQPEFLAGLRELCDEHEVLLIFDEVVTGFRLAYGGAQEFYGVEPDLATYGKAIGCGTPIGAVCGADEILRYADPTRSPDGLGAYVSGTLSGNPLCAAAGLATLDVLDDDGVYERLHAYGDRFRALLDELLADASFSGSSHGVGPVVDYALTDEDADPTRWSAIATADSATKREIDLRLLERGLFHHVGGKRYVSTAHDDEAFERTADAYASAFASVDADGSAVSTD